MCVRAKPSPKSLRAEIASEVASPRHPLGHHTVLYLSERRGDLQGKAEFAETRGTMGVVEGKWRVEEKERQRVVEEATGNERAFIPGRGSEWQTRQVRTPDQTRRAVR